MGIPFQGQRTPADYTRINLLRFRPGWGTGLVLALPAAAALWTFLTPRPDDPHPGRSLAISIVALVLTLSLLLITFRTVLRREASTDLAKAQVDGQFTEAGLESTTSFGHSSLPWAQFRQVKTSPSLLLLIHVNQFYVGFPRRFFASEEDWQAALALATSKVAPTPALANPANRLLAATGAIIVLALLWARSRGRTGPPNHRQEPASSVPPPGTTASR